MALVIKDRVRQTSTTAGTGTITLSGSVTGYQNFSVIGVSNTTYYTITDASGNWEVGLGTYVSPNQLARTTVYESSNGNALVNFPAGTKDVFVTFPAEGFANPPIIGDTTPNTIIGTTITGNTQVSAPVGVYTNYVYSSYFFTSSGGATPAITKLGSIAGFSNAGLILNDNDAGFYRLEINPNTGYPGGANYYSDGTAHTFNGQITITEIGPGNPGFIQIYDPVTTGVTLRITIDPSTYSPTITGFDATNFYPLQCNSGIIFPAGIDLDVGRTNSIILSNSTGASVKLKNDPTTPTYYTITLPPSAGSANQVLKTDGSGNLSWTTQGVQGTAPVTVTTATYTVAATDQWIIGNRAGTITLTLPTASSYTGRSLNIKTIQAQTVVSASSNVVPLAGGAAGTAILAATAGKFATLVSDGTNWIIMAGN